MARCRYYGFIAAACLLTALAAPTAEAGDEASRPQVLVPAHFDVSPPLRDIKPTEPRLGPPRAVVNRTVPKLAKGGGGDDPTVQSAQGPGEMPAPLLSIEGLSNADNATVLGFRLTPPDTQGDVGPNHYIQWINLIFAIYDKSGTKIYPPQPGPPGAAGNTIWTGFPGPCATDNDGDPVTLYDHLADRWLMSQFSATAPYRECVAVSTTGDPTGSWYRYEYVVTNSKFPDYPKFGVWPNAYYMSANQFLNLASWGGQGVWAFDRAAMIAGNPTASVIYFDLFGVNSNFGNAFPADLDGPAPPAGADGIFLEWDDAAWLGDPTDTVRLWYFHPDFTTPANSTFGLSGQPNQLIPTANVDPNMCGFSRACIPMPAGGESVDALSERLMHRLQYRNFGTHQTIVTALTVDADNTDHAGVHWFELRKAGSSWAIQQEGTYAPDSLHRWMGSAAMDAGGNIAVGYSVSSSATYPSVRYAGRLAGDPAGTLGQGEATLVAGSGVFTQGNNHRWGDYSMLAVDPSDECTFWYTQEYVAAPGGSWAWNTRFGSFKFPNCPDLIFKDGFQTPPLFDSGPLITHPGGGAGGADVSRLQSTSLGMTILGFGHQIVNTNSVADDFTVPAGPGWGVTQITFFAYQTGSTTTSTINDVRVQLWNGPPNAGGTVIWGDLTTNRLASTTFSNIYRDSETAPGGSTRPIMKVVATVPTSLAPGTYWVQWQMGGTLASGPWAPPITILTQTTTGNALQNLAGTWGTATDVGQQGFKFMVHGAVLP